MTAPLGIPPLSEQERIVTEIDRCISIIRETEVQVDTNLQRAARMRQAILGKAFKPTQIEREMELLA
jgi:type I restriction enzyme S subunit